MASKAVGNETASSAKTVDVFAASLIFLLCGMAIGASLGSYFGPHYGEAQVRREAVDHGFAEWKLNSDGEPEFFWKRGFVVDGWGNGHCISTN